MRVLLALMFTLAAARAQTIRLSDAQSLEIGKRIWKNECAGTVSGLTSWNKGEDFASLGIAHFIWYVEGRRGPFEESFPKLVSFLSSQDIEIPSWMRGACPWKTRSEFVADIESPRMLELRGLLRRTIAEQARFAALRLERALPQMLSSAPAGDRERIKKNFYRVAETPLGPYALIDYVNFKGEGTSPTERYQGEGWGLLQVLEAMPSDSPPLPAFVEAADGVLTRRVRHSPPARHEEKWLPGWRSRLRTYLN